MATDLEIAQHHVTEKTRKLYERVWITLDPAAPRWNDLRDDERSRWVAYSNAVFQAALDEIGIPLLKNGAGRVFFVADAKEIVIVVTESQPVTVLAVDNGLLLQVNRTASPTDRHPSHCKISARRIEPATFSLEEDGGLPLPTIPKGTS